MTLPGLAFYPSCLDRGGPIMTECLDNLIMLFWAFLTGSQTNPRARSVDL